MTSETLNYSERPWFFDGGIRSTDYGDAGSPSKPYGFWTTFFTSFVIL